MNDKLPKKIIELRDAEWEKYKDENPPKGQAKFYYKDNAEYFQDGFDAGFKCHTELTKGLIKALESIAAEDTFIEYLPKLSRETLVLILGRCIEDSRNSFWVYKKELESTK